MLARQQMTVRDPNMNATRRLVERALRCALGASVVLSAVLLTSGGSLHAVGAAGFGIRVSYNNVPDLSQPGSFATGPVVYSLPDAATSLSIYAGPTEGYFDTFARVPDGREMTTGYGMIMTMSGDGLVRFEPHAIGGGSDPPNNISYSLNPDFRRHTDFEILYAVVNVREQGGLSAAVIGVHDVAATDVPLNDNDGLFAMPIRVEGGVTGVFQLSFNEDPVYTGFINSLGQVLDNSPTQNGVVEVRASVPGDMNGDGTADAADIPGFLAALADRAAFIAEYPWLQTDYVADFNEDRSINFADVAGFEAACGCDTGVEPMPGDINGDMIVDRMDVAEFIALFGRGGQGEAAAPANGGALTGDFDGDGRIAAGDLVILQMHLGDAMAVPAIAIAGPAAVPEPCSSLVAFVAAILLFVARARRGNSIGPD